MKPLEFVYRGERIVLQVASEGEGWRVLLPDGSEQRVLNAQMGDDGSLTLRSPAGAWQMFFHLMGDEIAFCWQGRVYRFQRSAGRDEPAAHSTAEGMLTAPMPGLIRKVLVQVGEQVEAGQPLLVLEAMKTEQVLRAPSAGVVQSLNCREGDIVSEGAILVEIAEPSALLQTAHPVAPSDDIAHAAEGEPRG